MGAARESGGQRQSPQQSGEERASFFLQALEPLQGEKQLLVPERIPGTLWEGGIQVGIVVVWMKMSASR